MTAAQLTEVWAPLTVGIALISGFLFGFGILGLFAVDPQYATRDVEPLEASAWTAATIAAIGLVFYGGQVLTAYLDGDIQWTRIVSRYAIWVFYSVAIGAGLWLRIHRHLRRKAAEVHERAVTELEQDES